MPPKDAASSSGIPKGFKVVQKRRRLFQKYASKDPPNVIDYNQMESLLSDLDIRRSDDVRVLILAWKMKAARRGHFTWEEWLRGLKTLQVDNIKKLRKVLITLEEKCKEPGFITDLYSYSFGYYETETQKCLEMERACQLLKLFLTHQYHAHAESLVEFLKTQNRYTTIDRVQWMSFLPFCLEINYPNFDNYMSSPRWPPILDDYVEGARKRQNDKGGEIDALFKQYADKDSLEVISPEGIEGLCKDLGVEIMDVRVLMIAWKMQPARQGYFTLEEWRSGLEKLKVDTIGKLREALPALEQEVMEPQTFKEFYSFSFQYSLTEQGQKTLDMESACQLLEVVLGKCNHAQVESLVEFLKSQTEYNCITFDQWEFFLKFCHKYKYPNFENYDSHSSWPVIMDNYVEWEQNRQS